MAEPQDVHGEAAQGLVTLICPPGAETAPISHGALAWEAYRESGPGRGRWLVDVPGEVAHFLCWNGGFAPLDPTLKLFARPHG
jgi:hypothetical protein